MKSFFKVKTKKGVSRAYSFSEALARQEREGGIITDFRNVVIKKTDKQPHNERN